MTTPLKDLKSHPFTVRNRSKAKGRRLKLDISNDVWNKAFALAFGADQWKLEAIGGGAYTCYGTPDKATGAAPQYRCDVYGCTCAYQERWKNTRWCSHRLACGLRDNHDGLVAECRAEQKRRNEAAERARHARIERDEVAATLELYGPA